MSTNKTKELSLYFFLVQYVDKQNKRTFALFFSNFFFLWNKKDQKISHANSPQYDVFIRRGEVRTRNWIHQIRSDQILLVNQEDQWVSHDQPSDCSGYERPTHHDLLYASEDWLIDRLTDLSCDFRYLHWDYWFPSEEESALGLGHCSTRFHHYRCATGVWVSYL